jgi:2-polyprenyl-3-methyl-5-hydroxy-6-metoxy-1,4-benzoquinol methylase
MSDWQERITRETAPTIRAEHELRYRLAQPLVASSTGWADLGCGNGIAAAVTLGSALPEHVLLADADASAVGAAAAELQVPESTQLAGDLTDAELLERIGAELRSFGERCVVTCFEVVEHLATFVPLVEWSRALARDGAATFVISVPNDAFWSIQNPHHATAWGEGAFEELRRLLPAEQTLVRQVALSGSAAIGWDGERSDRDVRVATGGEDAVATHFIAAYGPRHAELARSAVVTQVDMLEQRRWERQRENDLALMQKGAESYDANILELQQELQERTVWFEEWRTYIHELEGELGRPLSGVSPETLPERSTEDQSEDDAGTDAPTDSAHAAGTPPGKPA